MSEIERLNVTACDVKVAGEEEGIVEAIVGVTANIDDGNDRIIPGTFAESLTRRGLPALMAGHNWDKDVGVVEAAEEMLPGDSRLPADLADNGFGGVMIRARYNLDANDAEARQVYSRIKFKSQYGPRTQQWSIGYIPTETNWAGEVREIKAMDWLEASSVAVAMNQAVYTLAVKSLDGAPTDVAEWVKRHANGGPPAGGLRGDLQEAWEMWVKLFDAQAVEIIEDISHAVEAAKLGAALVKLPMPACKIGEQDDTAELLRYQLESARVRAALLS